ncbi:hypothetical protein WOLCODRAFT_166367 [Wolfiporia cocos MD-104 SS10]|uniref:Uncharacterized protein n=1 Tax=Wolfiporia cocos (strain MD-104) TaxID=742152 RepID=A0A2H3J0X4_WOLCO|nr:hypothetical protein WOLCODRAFT_166367 [Wolfiporia cocos MD-104 SS10]
MHGPHRASSQRVMAMTISDLLERSRAIARRGGGCFFCSAQAAWWPFLWLRPAQGGDDGAPCANASYLSSAQPGARGAALCTHTSRRQIAHPSTTRRTLHFPARGRGCPGTPFETITVGTLSCPAPDRRLGSAGEPPRQIRPTSLWACGAESTERQPVGMWPPGPSCVSDDGSDSVGKETALPFVLPALFYTFAPDVVDTVRQPHAVSYGPSDRGACTSDPSLPDADRSPRRVPDRARAHLVSMTGTTVPALSGGPRRAIRCVDASMQAVKLRAAALSCCSHLALQLDCKALTPPRGRNRATRSLSRRP